MGERGGHGRGGGNHPPSFPVSGGNFPLGFGRGEDVEEREGGGGGYFSHSQVTRGRGEEGPHGRRGVDRAPPSCTPKDVWSAPREIIEKKTFFYSFMVHF